MKPGYLLTSMKEYGECSDKRVGLEVKSPAGDKWIEFIADCWNGASIAENLIPNERIRIKLNWPDPDGWIDHVGDVCPVEGDVVVDILMKDGGITNKMPAGGRYWKQNPGRCSIVKYRLHTPETNNAADPYDIDDHIMAVLRWSVVEGKVYYYQGEPKSGWPVIGNLLDHPEDYSTSPPEPKTVDVGIWQDSRDKYQACVNHENINPNAKIYTITLKE